MKIDKTQHNKKCRLCGDRDETIYHIISERSKLAQKEYMTRHDWVGKVIHWELCKKLEFDHTTKWYMHKSEWENETQKSLLDFETQTDNLNMARRLELKIINKKKKSTCVSADHKVKIKQKKKGKERYQDLARELKIGMKHEGDSYTNVTLYTSLAQCMHVCVCVRVYAYMYLWAMGMHMDICVCVRK